MIQTIVVVLLKFVVVREGEPVSNEAPHLFNGEGFDIARDWRTMRESLARLRQERDELRARVEQLEQALREAISAIDKVQGFDLWAVRDNVAAALEQKERCADCDKAARLAYSDAATPGFVYDKCEKHRAALEQKEVKESQ